MPLVQNQLDPGQLQQVIQRLNRDQLKAQLQDQVRLCQMGIRPTLAPPQQPLATALEVETLKIQDLWVSANSQKIGVGGLKRVIFVHGKFKSSLHATFNMFRNIEVH